MSNEENDEGAAARASGETPKRVRVESNLELPTGVMAFERELWLPVIDGVMAQVMAGLPPDAGGTGQP